MQGLQCISMKMHSKKFIAIITARGGSKGLPRKNILPLNGKPLIAHSIEAAMNSGKIFRCIVSTEDKEIKEVSLRYGAEVFDRPFDLAADNSKSQDVILNVLTKVFQESDPPKHFILLQPTSPLRTTEHINESIDAYLKSSANSLISVTEAEHHPYRCLRLEEDHLVPLFDLENLNGPRQLLPKIFRQNGAIYIGQIKKFLIHKAFFIPPVVPYYMASGVSMDIDNGDDLLIAELLFNKYK